MKKKITCIVLFLLFSGLICTVLFYKTLFADNINDVKEAKSHILYIPTGSTYEDVLKSLKSQHILKNAETFKLVCSKLDYNSHIKPGKYRIDDNSGNLFLVRKLRAGSQEPVRITFNNIRNKEQLATKIAGQLETSKKELLSEFNNARFLDSLGLTEENFPTIFLANTYEFHWNTSATQFIDRMLKEYTKFWNASRLSKAQSLSLTPTEITILASIIQKESNHYDEYPTIAGVYINRLNRNWPLQADPTVMYALNKIGIKRRVYQQDLKIVSPYNTYLNKGLPPGPICLPELKSIDETLNAEEHNYMYFCAKEDFSGYHVFAETWEEHKANASRYQKALNRNNIR